VTYEATTTEITVVEGVEVDITVRGDEDRAEKVLLDLKERLGILGAAYDAEVPPDALGDVPEEFVPPMSVAWDRVFDYDPDELTPQEGVVGECDECGVEIRYGEWHVQVEPESDRVPDNTATSVVCGDPDETTRLCGPCSDRDPEAFPDDEPTAGVEEGDL
jgi:hypothetical protein